MEEQATIYYVTIDGQLRENWAEWLNVLSVDTHYAPGRAASTTVTVCVPDQSALRGLMNKLWDLNLTLMSVSTGSDAEDPPQE